MKDQHGEQFCRKDLVLAVANREVAQTDPEMEEEMYKLSASNSLGWLLTTDDTTRPMDSNPVYPAIRQAYWELVQTFEQLRDRGLSLPA